jgi:hypothetical protein
MAFGGGPAATPRATPTKPAARPRGRAPRVGALLLAWAVIAAGCAGGSGVTAAARAPVLYVANGRDGTVTRFAAAGGAVLGAPLPAGEVPWQLAVGPSGELLILSATARPGARLTRVSRDSRAGDGWRTQRVDLEPGARAPVLAGGGRHAVVAYEAGDTAVELGPRRCRLVRVDLATGHVGAAHDVCRGPETVVGLAVEAGGAAGASTQAGALVYLALWRRPVEATTACDGATGSRILALRLDTGAPVAAAPLAGVPGPLVLANAPGRLGRRLYAVEAAPGADVAGPGRLPTDCRAAGYEEQFAGARAWRVWGLDATTLIQEASATVSHPVRALAVTPDGEDAFALTEPPAVHRLAPAGGPPAWTTSLPGPALGLAATDDRVFTVDAYGDRVWGLDRRRGAVVQRLATGRGPTGVVLSGN